MSIHNETLTKLSRLPGWAGVNSVRGETALELAKLADRLVLEDDAEARAASKGAALLVMDCERRAHDAALKATYTA